MADDFIPAAHLHCLTPCYDTFARLFFGRAFRRMARLIAPEPGQKILDIGCGPGNFIVALHRVQPQAVFSGLDVDPAILKVARTKLQHHGITADLIEASATDIPLQQPFDLMVSTLMFHHLDASQKPAMLQEIFRLLKPGGKFYLYDFAPPRNGWEKLLARIYGKFEPVEDGVAGKYPKLLQSAGFEAITSRYHSPLLELLEVKRSTPYSIAEALERQR